MRCSPARDQPCDVRHIDHHQRSGFPCGLRDSFEVNRARIGACADDDQPRLTLARQPLQFFIVDRFSIFANAVRHEVVVLSGEVQRMAVREMSSMGKVHPHDGVSRLQHREIDRHIRLASGVRLDIDMLGAEQLFRALDGEAFNDVRELAPPVVTASWIALRILVRKHRPRSFENGPGGEVLRCDHFKAKRLPPLLVFDGVVDFGIDLAER